MNILQRFERWGDSHHPKWLDFIRIGLGIFLIYKGVDFLMHMSTLIGKMSGIAEFGAFAFILIGHYVVFAHILGGLLIAVGFYTRLACLIQLPILLVAVFFINTKGVLLHPYSEFFLSVFVLCLLLFFLVIGNGTLSLKFNEEKN